MSSNFEKSVKGGTKVKLAAPKTKYVEHILLATQSGEAGVAEVFRTLTHRLRDSTWTVAFKSLIIVHLMIKEGAQNATLAFLATNPRNKLAINQFTDVQTQGQNIRRYSDYLVARAHGFAASHIDYVRTGEGRMKRISVDKGLLRETEVVQEQIKALVKCDLLENDVENEISLTAFRLLTRDLLDLYNVENEAVMNVLSHYFEMSKPDAERAIRIYKVFCKQTDQVVQYLSVARQFEHATRLEIPKIKHAPTSLVNSLQEYLDDKDFDTNRRQYLAEQDAKKDGKPFQRPAAQPKPQSQPPPSQPPTAQPSAPPAAAQEPKGPAPDLIDFFESIEQNQQPMAQNVPQYQQPQPTGFPMQAQPTGFASPQQPFGFQQPPPQQPAMNGFMDNTGSSNPFMQQAQQQQQMPQQQAMPQQQSPQPLQSQFTGAGFGGYGPQPQQPQHAFPTGNPFGQDPSCVFGNPMHMQPPPQIQEPQIQQQQPPPQPMQPQPTGSTNPFRQSMMPTGTPPTGGLQRQSTNPFAQRASQPQPQPQQPIQSQPTGTNPFSRNITPISEDHQTTTSPPPSQPPPSSSQPSLSPLQMQPTGSTNPFRQSTFVNQQTGMGWQNAGPQATIGGWGDIGTVEVFPRPGGGQQQGGQQQWQGQQQSPWG
ncbi:ANTH-domain-containing protein [Hortaea werneckii]|nr:ANTH-domain-containing protein [Hortaea werneckii]